MDYIHCHRCYIRVGAEVKFYITSCGHIVCKNCLPSPQLPNCVTCAGKNVQTIPIGREMPAHLASYFNPNLLEEQKNLTKRYEFQLFQFKHLFKREAANNKQYEMVAAEIDKRLNAFKKSVSYLKLPKTSLLNRNKPPDLGPRKAVPSNMRAALSPVMPPINNNSFNKSNRGAPPVKNVPYLPSPEGNSFSRTSKEYVMHATHLSPAFPNIRDVSTGRSTRHHDRNGTMMSLSPSSSVGLSPYNYKSQRFSMSSNGNNSMSSAMSVFSSTSVSDLDDTQSTLRQLNDSQSTIKSASTMGKIRPVIENHAQNKRYDKGGSNSRNSYSHNGMARSNSNSQNSMARSNSNSQNSMARSNSNSQNGMARSNSNSQNGMARSNSNSQNSMARSNSNSQNGMARSNSNSQNSMARSNSNSQNGMARSNSNSQNSMGRSSSNSQNGMARSNSNSLNNTARSISNSQNGIARTNGTPLIKNYMPKGNGNTSCTDTIRDNCNSVAMGNGIARRNNNMSKSNGMSGYQMIPRSSTPKNYPMPPISTGYNDSTNRNSNTGQRPAQGSSRHGFPIATKSGQSTPNNGYHMSQGTPNSDRSTSQKTNLIQMQRAMADPRHQMNKRAGQNMERSAGNVYDNSSFANYRTRQEMSPAALPPRTTEKTPQSYRLASPKTSSSLSSSASQTHRDIPYKRPGDGSSQLRTPPMYNRPQPSSQNAPFQETLQLLTAAVKKNKL